MSSACGGGTDGIPPRGPGPGRRAVLGAAVLAPLAVLLRSRPAHAVDPQVQRRASWAASPDVPELAVERPEDVRFLLVHHSATTNDYGRDGVGAQLREFHRLHTGPERGWPDIAYNFLVDRYGGIWEGRSGSLAGPVMGSATGGSQGYAQLACFIGDLSAVPPTPAARASMLHLLAALAQRYGIDTSPGATATFTSRGSNRWPEGTPVTTATIAGHRDMSRTSCPGDAFYGQLRSSFPAEVTALRAAMTVPSAAPSRSAASPTPVPPTTTPSALPPTTTPSAAPPTSAAAPVASTPPAAAAAGTDGGPGGGTLAAAAAALAAAGAAGGAVAARVRRRQG